MSRFVEGEDRGQSWLLPSSLEDYVSPDNPVRVVEAFIDELDLGSLGFSGVEPAATGRPGYHPATLLKIYLYGYLIPALVVSDSWGIPKRLKLGFPDPERPIRRKGGCHDGGGEDHAVGPHGG